MRGEWWSRGRTRIWWLAGGRTRSCSRCRRRHTNERLGVAGVEGFAASLADDLGRELVAAVVLHDQRRGLLAGPGLVAPAHPGGGDRVTVPAPRRAGRVATGRGL